jgi:hypothetical protein
VQKFNSNSDRPRKRFPADSAGTANFGTRVPLIFRAMTKVSVIDISDPNKITDILEGETDEPTEHVEQITKEEEEDEEDGVVPRLLFRTLSTLTMLVPLTSVHIALDIIVHQQYAQSVDAVEIAARAATAALGIVCDIS